MLVLRCDESIVTLLVLRRYGVSKVRWFVSAGLKARVQRTVRVILARVGERVARTGRESRSTRESELHAGALF